MLRKPGGTDMGTYRVYKTFHEFDQNGRYRCEFEALPSDLEYLPTPEVPIPTPNPIEVKVWDNEDPKGLGRVRVEFPFDERTCETWIPVMTFDAGSDAGGSGQVKTNRGTVIIPEKGDSCLLHFLDGQHLAHPFIMGSLFHGENASEQGGGKGNHIKSFYDKAGSFYKFNTKEGSITIQDKKGSESRICWDGQQNIHVSAGNMVDISVGNGKSTLIMEKDGNIMIDAAKDICVTVGGSMIELTKEEVSLSASKIKIAGGEIEIKGKGSWQGGKIKIN